MRFRNGVSSFQIIPQSHPQWHPQYVAADTMIDARFKIVHGTQSIEGIHSVKARLLHSHYISRISLNALVIEPRQREYALCGKCDATYLFLSFHH